MEVLQPQQGLEDVRLDVGRGEHYAGLFDDHLGSRYGEDSRMSGSHLQVSVHEVHHDGDRRHVAEHIY